MRTIMRIWVVAVIMVLCAFKPLQAQEESKPAEAENKAKAERPEKPVHAYRIDFSISELEDGKKINSRHYSMDLNSVDRNQILNSGDRNQIKIGTRIPVVTETLSNKPEAAQYQYLDVGTNLNCRLEERGDELALDVHADFSNLTNNAEQHSAQPVIRQILITGSTLATVGKPVVIGVADDPNSNRTFQLEAMVTKLK